MEFEVSQEDSDISLDIFPSTPQGTMFRIYDRWDVEYCASIILTDENLFDLFLALRSYLKLEE